MFKQYNLRRSLQKKVNLDKQEIRLKVFNKNLRIHQMRILNKMAAHLTLIKLRLRKLIQIVAIMTNNQEKIQEAA